MNSGVCNYRHEGSPLWLAIPSCDIKYTGTFDEDIACSMGVLDIVEW